MLGSRACSGTSVSSFEGLCIARDLVLEGASFVLCTNVCCSILVNQLTDIHAEVPKHI